MALAPRLRADYPPDLLRLSGGRMLLSRKRRHPAGRKLAGRSGCGAWKTCTLSLFAGRLWMVRFLVRRLLPRRPGDFAACAMGSSTALGQRRLCHSAEHRGTAFSEAVRPTWILSIPSP